MKRVIAIAGVSLLAGPALSADPISIGRVRVQLYYEFSGKLSPDIAPPAKFDLWNVGAGEGSAAEDASDVLVTVPLKMKPSDSAEFTTLPLTLSARTAAGKLLGTRTYGKGLLLVPTMGTSWARLWLNEVQCAGRVTFEARYGAQRQTAMLNFDCGE